jgi:hypothetical protein
MNSVTIVGFVGADPEQRQARNNGSKFTVLSVATQRSGKDAEDEWVSKVEWHRIAIFRPRLAEAVLTDIKKSNTDVCRALITARLARMAAVRPPRGLPTNKEFYSTPHVLFRAHLHCHDRQRAIRAENVQLRPVFQGVVHRIGYGMLRQQLLFRKALTKDSDTFSVQIQ